MSPCAEAFRWLTVLATACRVPLRLVASATRHGLVPAHNITCSPRPTLVDYGAAAAHLVLTCEPKREERSAGPATHEPDEKAPNLRGVLRKKGAHPCLHNDFVGLIAHCSWVGIPVLFLTRGDPRHGSGRRIADETNATVRSGRAGLRWRLPWRRAEGTVAGGSDGIAKGRIMARLSPITRKDQVAAKDHAVFDGIVASRGAVQGPFTMFLHSPELAGRVAHLGAYVRFEGSLDMRVRVLAAMTAAREFESVYVWGAQTGGARRLGVPETTIAAIRENHSRGLPPEDAEIVDFTRQLLRRHRADEASFNKIRARFGDDGLIQLTGAIGYYSLLAMTVNACELEAASGAEVLPA